MKDTRGKDGRISGVIWITGYSGAGKTTVMRQVVRLLEKRKISTVSFDGDDLRAMFGNRWGYDRAARIDLGYVNHSLFRYVAIQGHTVVIAAGGMYNEILEWVKAHVPYTIQVYLNVSEDERRRRDAQTKHVYKELTNVAMLYDDLEAPDLTIENVGGVLPDLAAERIVEYFLSDAVVDTSSSTRLAHWDHYYQSSKSCDEPSAFARFLAPTLPPGARVLDVGCGSGADMHLFAAHGAEVTGVDPSAAAISQCRNRNGMERVRTLRGILSDHAAELKDFDVLFCHGVLDAITEREELLLLKEARRVLRPGGRIFIECLSANDPGAREGNVLGPGERLTDRYSRFVVANRLVDNLTDVGFDVGDPSEQSLATGNQMHTVIRVQATKGGGKE